MIHRNLFSRTLPAYRPRSFIRRVHKRLGRAKSVRRWTCYGPHKFAGNRVRAFFVQQHHWKHPRA